MTTLQEYFNNKYPTQSEKEQVREIIINDYSFKELDGGELNLCEYSNLERVKIHGDCLNSKLTYLDLSNCAKLKELFCWYNSLTKLDLNPNAKLEKLNIDNNNFSEQDLSFFEWIEKGFSGQEVKEWTEIGLQPTKAKEWSESFNYEECKEWLSFGFTPQDIYFCAWLKNTKQLTPEQTKDNKQQLREEFNECWKQTSITTQQWLEQNYPSKETETIYINQQLEGVLDCSGYWRLEYIFISSQVDNSKFEIKKGSYREEELFIGEKEKNKETQITHCIPVQTWLDQNYLTLKKREETTELNIGVKGLEGTLDLSDFKNLEELDCSDNCLTNLNLNNCEKLSWINCSNNCLAQIPHLPNPKKIAGLGIKNNNFSQDLSVFSQMRNLEELEISNEGKNKINQNIYNRFYGSLEPLKDLNKLKSLNISNTNVDSGLEYLPESCQVFYCDSVHPYHSIELKKELDKSNCFEMSYYNLNKWRANKANSDTVAVIPLERLVVIRGNLKSFVNRWGIKEGNDKSELSKLQDPEKINTYWYVGEGGQWIARSTAFVGGVLAATVNPVLGGVLAAASPGIEIGASQIKERFYEAKEKKWNCFLTDADTFLDNFNELLGVVKQVEIGKLGEVNEALANLKRKVYDFLNKYDKDDNEEIEIKELIEERGKFSQELDKVGEIIRVMKELEEKIIRHQQGRVLVDKDVRDFIKELLERIEVLETSDDFKWFGKEFKEKFPQREINKIFEPKANREENSSGQYLIISNETINSTKKYFLNLFDESLWSIKDYEETFASENEVLDKVWEKIAENALTKKQEERIKNEVKKMYKEEETINKEIQREKEKIIKEIKRRFLKKYEASIDFEQQPAEQTTLLETKLKKVRDNYQEISQQLVEKKNQPLPNDKEIVELEKKLSELDQEIKDVKEEIEKQQIRNKFIKLENRLKNLGKANWWGSKISQSLGTTWNGTKHCATKTYEFLIAPSWYWEQWNKRNLPPVVNEETEEKELNKNQETWQSKIKKLLCCGKVNSEPSIKEQLSKNSLEIQEIIDNQEIKDEHSEQQEWKDKGFTEKQTKQWIEVGLTTSEVNFATWLRDIMSKDVENFADPQWVKEKLATEELNLEELKQGYNEYQKEQLETIIEIPPK